MGTCLRTSQKTMRLACVVVCALLLNQGFGQEDAYIHEKALLERHGLEDPAAYISARNTRIENELTAIAKQAKRLEGVGVYDQTITVSAKVRPDLVRLDQILGQLAREWLNHNESPYISGKLLARGMDQADLSSLGQILQSVGTPSDFKSKQMKAYWSTRLDLIERRTFEEATLKAHLEEYDRLNKASADEWPRLVLEALSLKGRRILLSYAFELEHTSLTVGHPRGIIDQARIADLRTRLKKKAREAGL